MDQEDIKKKLDVEIKKQIADGYINPSEIKIELTAEDKAAMLFKGATLKKHKGIRYH